MPGRAHQHVVPVRQHAVDQENGATEIRPLVIFANAQQVTWPGKLINPERQRQQRGHRDNRSYGVNRNDSHAALAGRLSGKSCGPSADSPRVVPLTARYLRAHSLISWQVPTTPRQQFLHVIERGSGQTMTHDSTVFPPGSPPCPGVAIRRYDSGVWADKPQEDRDDAAQNFPPIYLEGFRGLLACFPEAGQASDRVQATSPGRPSSARPPQWDTTCHPVEVPQQRSSAR